MIETIQQINFLLALAGIGALVVTLVLLYDLLNKRKLSKYVESWGLCVAFIVTIGAGSMTLVYSEFFGLIPCGLCWFERIALYPQALLLAVSLWYRDANVARYGIALSSFGLIVSLYHHYLQMGGSQFIKCPLAGTGSDCAKRFMFEFDFMTFPLLAAILFAFLIVLYVYLLRTKNS